MVKYSTIAQCFPIKIINNETVIGRHSIKIIIKYTFYYIIQDTPTHIELLIGERRERRQQDEATMKKLV
jgi:hypothetical protein